MPSSLRLSTRELLILLLVIAAVATAIVLLVKVQRHPAEDYCLGVDAGAATLVAGEQLQPLSASAAADPWIAERDERPFAHYYVIAMSVRTPDGADIEALWGVGTNNEPPAAGQPLWFDAEHSAVTSLDSAAAERARALSSSM